MPTTLPAGAIVRPRVICRTGSEALLLEDVIAEIADATGEVDHDSLPGFVWIIGGPGTGKSTAVAHLRALFAGDDRVCFLDEPAPEELEHCGKTKARLVVATAHSRKVRQGIFLPLQPWGFDDLVEYLLAVHKTACKSVIGRLGVAARRRWTPQIARIVLDRFAADASVTDTNAVLLAEVRRLLPDPVQFAAAADFCLALLSRRSEGIQAAVASLGKVDWPPGAGRLVRHAEVQLAVAADWITSQLASGESCRSLAEPLPVELVDLIGNRCRDDARVVRRLLKMLKAPRTELADAMAVSILLRCDPMWRPKPKRRGAWRLSGGYFQGAAWNGVDLARAGLSKAEFSGARLVEAQLRETNATDACFDRAEMSGTNMMGTRALRASFRGAHVRRARLSGADFTQADLSGAELSDCALMKADLTGADLTSARLRRADLTGAHLLGADLAETDFAGAILRRASLSLADLRRAELEGACFERANLSHAQMEGVSIDAADFRAANLRHAHLTGTTLPSADLRDADLSGAHLAEIHWERADLRNADLRGVSFHMGSSRSGLVGSPIALEGSMTGFYTDDREEIYFKRPEEIRKANLRRADLRGARIDDVDFYLVDLREARLDPDQRRQARRTGAILVEIPL